MARGRTFYCVRKLCLARPKNWQQIFEMLHAWRDAVSLSAQLFTHVTAEALPKCVHFIFAQNLHKILSCLGATPAAIGMKYYSTSLLVAEEIFSFEIVNLMLKIIAEATTSIGRLNHWEISSATLLIWKASFFGEKLRRVGSEWRAKKNERKTVQKLLGYLNYSCCRACCTTIKKKHSLDGG